MTQTTNIKKTLRAERNAREREILREALESEGGNVSAVARRLGLSRNGVHVRLVALGLQTEAAQIRERASSAPKLCVRCNGPIGGAS